MNKTFKYYSFLVFASLFPINVSADEVKGIYIHTNGNVGVGTTTPTSARLEVNSPTVGDYSILAHGTIHATSYCNASDQRIKSREGLSDNDKDLVTLRNIQITDYHFIDPKSADVKVKKLIGQQLYQVYPQAVKLGVGTINDIMAATTMSGNEILIRHHDLQVGDVIRVRFEGKYDQALEVLAASTESITVNKSFSGEVTVLGRQVDDFHYVDYDAVSMLAVSAIQSLANTVDTQAQTIQTLTENNQQLERRMDLLINHVCEQDSTTPVCN